MNHVCRSCWGSCGGMDSECVNHVCVSCVSISIFDRLATKFSQPPPPFFFVLFCSHVNKGMRYWIRTSDLLPPSGRSSTGGRASPRAMRGSRLRARVNEIGVLCTISPIHPVRFAVLMFFLCATLFVDCLLELVDVKDQWVSSYSHLYSRCMQSRHFDACTCCTNALTR